MENTVNHVYEFGAYRVDPTRRLLLKDGEAVALTPKVFDTLLVLVSSDGRTLEKDELMREVWAGVVVEEVGLAKNISVLRKVLGESPDHHRYIVTVPGRGYRFVAGVRIVPADGVPADCGVDGTEETIIETHTVARIISEEEVTEAVFSGHAAHPVPLPATHRRRRAGTVLSLAALLLLTAAGLLWLLHRPPLSERDSVLLADFRNQTGDPAFDAALKQGLAVELEQSPFLNIFPDERVRQTLRLMGRSPDERVSGDVGREICQRQGLKALIAGSIAALGRHYAVTLEAVDSHSGETLARAQVEAESKEQVLKALSQAASRLREKLGESLGSVQRFEALLELTTPSLEALKAYSLGNQEARRGKWPEAIPFYRTAVELDPNFAYAYAGLATMYRNTKQPRLAADYISKAYTLKDRVSERERLLITSFYYEHVTGEIDKNIETLKLYRQTYPRDPQVHISLALGYGSLGQFENALEESRMAMALDPNAANRYSTVGGDLVRLNRFSEAADIYRRASEQRLDNMAVHHGLYRLAFLNRNPAAIDQQLKWADGRPNEYLALDWQADSACFLGQWRRSAEYARRAIDVAVRSGENEVAAADAGDAALRGAIIGQCAQASALASRAMSIEPDQVSLPRASLALAICGESGEAERLAEQLTASYPKNTLINAIWLPLIHAATELRRGRPQSALDLLEPTASYEAAALFWPQHLRGEAYLQLHKGAEAATEYRKILDHRGQSVLSVLYSLAELGSARAAALTHDTAQARKAYRDFLQEWKDADADLPRLLEAKTEYGNLN